MARTAVWTPKSAVPGLTANRAERHRRFIVSLVLLIYVISLVEGSLRKWFLPELATPIYFLRDPFLMVLYAYSLKYGLMTRGALALNWLTFAVFTTGIGILPFIIYGIDLRAWVLGARTYWLYLPLAFVVANTFRREDIERFLHWNVLLAMPYAVLVIYQYQSSPWAWINKSISADDPAVGVALGLIRPNGLFTYPNQNVWFTAFLVANYIACLFMHRRARLRLLLLVPGAVAIASLAVLTGSRSIYFLVAAIVVASLVGSTLARPSGATLQRNGLVLLAMAVAALLFINVYDDMFMAMQIRFERAAVSEGSIWGRAFGGVIGFFEPMMTAPAFGYGIGTGTPGISRFLGAAHLRYGEGDLMRNINELGYLLGILFIGFRWFTAGLILRLGFSVAMRGYSSALPLAGYAAVPIAIGAITHSSLNGFLPWLAVGFVLAIGKGHRVTNGYRPSSGYRRF